MNSPTGDEVVKELISQLEHIGISDIALFDGTTLEVNSTISREADVSGSGSHRSAKRSSSHKKSSSESRNYQVKIHAVYSLVSKCLMGATITLGTGAESRNFYTDFITFAGKQILAIADRGYHSLLLFARCIKQGVPFIIRLDSQCTYKIREAYTSDGQPLPQLVGMKVNYSEVTQLAAEYQSLELVVD
ncbi:transposase, partial [Anaerobiospirillum succiniciproducens]|uniref:transposase n=1 Tax=Anaerobiospirillum succiniciproducens TaxID=13335 RepID=UPI003F886034